MLPRPLFLARDTQVASRPIGGKLADAAAFPMNLGRIKGRLMGGDAIFARFRCGNEDPRRNGGLGLGDCLSDTHL